MKIKSILTSFLRFDKQFVYVATEAGFFNSDVLGIDKNDRLLEFEIKVSYRDFLADFKKPKHALFQGEKPADLLSPYDWIDGEYRRVEEKVIPKRYLESIPYRFYFVVTKEIESKCLTYLTERKLPYGLYSFSEDDGLILIKRAPVLKNHEATERIKTTLALRMSSEIAGLRQQIINLKSSLSFYQNRSDLMEQRVLELNPDKEENENSDP